MDRKEKTKLYETEALHNKDSESSGRGRFRRRSDPGRMPADVLAKLIIGIVTAVLLLGLLVSLFLPSSQRQGPRPRTKSYKEKLQEARRKLNDGKDLIRKTENNPSAESRNALLKEPEEILWKSQEIYSELIDNHEGKGYEYFQTEIADVQSCILYCQKQRTITGFD